MMSVGMVLFSFEFISGLLISFGILLSAFPALQAWWRQKSQHRKIQQADFGPEPEYIFITEFKATEASDWKFRSQYRTSHRNMYGLFIVLRMGYDAMLDGLENAMWENGWYAVRIIMQSPAVEHQPVRLCFGMTTDATVEYFPPAGVVESVTEYQKLPAVKF